MAGGAPSLDLQAGHRHRRWYSASGTPSEADRGVITHGETGFFAHDDREWYDCLRAPVTDAELRARIGSAGRRHVEARYGVERITGMYVALFDQRLAGREGGRPRPSIDSRHPSA